MAELVPNARTLALREVQAAIRANDLPGATAKALAALAAGHEHPMLLNLRALKAEEEGRPADALSDLQRARVLAPADFTVLNALGLCFARLERYGEASAAFDAAIKLEPRFAPAHHNKGWVADMTGDLETARSSHELALKMNPNFPEASAALAMMAVRAGDFAQARERAERILERDKNQPTAQVALAAAEVATGEFAVAETRLRLLLSNDVRRILPQVLVTARGLWADALDGLDRPSEAFAAYAAEKAEIEQLHGARFRGGASVLGFTAWARDYFDAGEPWAAAEPAAPPERRHVFVVGFPGAGAELIAKAFTAGGEAVVLADQDALADGVRAYMTGPEGLDRLAAAADGDLDKHRQAYWDHVRAKAGDPEGRAVVDAAPFNLLRLPLIARMFPDALVLVARRDPRDVAVELMRRHFKLNIANYGLLTLDGAARLQDATLALAETYAAKVPIGMVLIRYEDLVGDAASVAEGLGEWAGAKAQPVAAHSRQTPGQWRRYARELEPVLPLLRPWVERFGYPAA
jgi:Tfp pilus assembly protein PilF